MEPTVAALRTALVEAADPSIAHEMSHYMRDRFGFLGVKTPGRRAASKLFIKQVVAGEDLIRPTVDELWDQPEREFQYVGADLLVKASAKLTDDDLDWVAGLVTKRSWWDTVDTLSRVIGDIALDRSGVWSRIDRWADSTGHIDQPTESAMWLARCSIIHQLRYTDRTDEDVLFDRCLRRAGDDEFFIRKAIGWALRQYARTDPMTVAAFVDTHEHQLSPLSVREATKHLR